MYKLMSHVFVHMLLKKPFRYKKFRLLVVVRVAGRFTRTFTEFLMQSVEQGNADAVTVSSLHFYL